MVGITAAAAVATAVAAIASWRSASAARDAANILSEERQEERSDRERAKCFRRHRGRDLVFYNAGHAQATDVSIEPRSSGVKVTPEALHLAVIDAKQAIRIRAVRDWDVEDMELELAWTDGTGRHRKPVVLRLP
jgi:hypothetical protein